MNKLALSGSADDAPTESERHLHTEEAQSEVE
jgi:hypothetical protein